MPRSSPTQPTHPNFSLLQPPHWTPAEQPERWGPRQRILAAATRRLRRSLLLVEASGREQTGALGRVRLGARRSERQRLRRPSSRQLSIQRCGRFDHDLRCERLQSLPSRHNETSGERRVDEHAVESLGDRLRRPIVQQTREAVFDHLRDTADVVGDDRNALCNRFEDRAGQALPPRCEDEDVRISEQPPDVALYAEKFDLIMQSQPRDLVQHLTPKWAVADDPKLDVWKSGSEQTERPYDEYGVLLVYETADEQHNSMVPGAPPLARGTERRHDDAASNQPVLRFRPDVFAQTFLQVGATHDNESVRAAGEPSLNPPKRGLHQARLPRMKTPPVNGMADGRHIRPSRRDATDDARLRAVGVHNVRPQLPEKARQRTYSCKVSAGPNGTPEFSDDMEGRTCCSHIVMYRATCLDLLPTDNGDANPVPGQLSSEREHRLLRAANVEPSDDEQGVKLRRADRTVVCHRGHHGRT